MQQPTSSKLKVRDSSQNPASTANPARTGTLRERFENETIRRESSERSRRNRKSKSTRGARKNSFTEAAKATSGIFSALKGIVVIGLLASGLYWAASLPSFLPIFSGKDEALATVPKDPQPAAQPNIATPAIATVAADNSIENLTESATQNVVNVEDEIMLEKLTAQSTAEPASSETKKLEVPAASTIDTQIASTTTAPTATSEQSSLSPPKSLKVATYRASIFSHPTSTTATETPIAHGTEVTMLERQGDWVKVEVEITNLVGYIHSTHLVE